MLIELIISITLVFICLLLSVFQFRQQGFLLNNAYIYLSKEDRIKMTPEEKKPHYIQSGVCFLLLSLKFFAMVLAILTEWKWLFTVQALLIIGVLAYAIISSVLSSIK